MANLKNTIISDTVFRLPTGDTAARPAGTNGAQLRFNTETGKLEQFRPGLGTWIAPSNTGVIATGGDAVYDVDAEGTTYRVHVFTATGTSTFSVLQGGSVEYLIVAGGGGGGGGNGGAGGGGGGVIFGSTNIDQDLYDVIIGAGGIGGVGISTSQETNGENSSIFGLQSLGGGYGPSQRRNGTGTFAEGGDGGSGGGGAGDGGSAGSTGPWSPGGNALQPTSIDGGFGNKGGTGWFESAQDGGGGGGGAGSPGEDAASNLGGNGGIGIQIAITGQMLFFAGGGGGASYNGSPSMGGFGGGGNGARGNLDEIAESGLPNTGGGGGGGDGGGDGGSGIVVIRYPLRQENPEVTAGKVVGDGLVLDLDFAKPTVYSGSGSVVSDSGLNGLEGSINGPTFVNPRTHRSAFEFDGSSTGITVENFPQIFADSLSLHGWIYFKDDGRGILFSNYNTSTDVAFEKHTDGRLRLYWNTGSPDIFSVDNVVNIDEWNFIGIQRNKEDNETQFYVNGVNVDNDSRTGTDLSNVQSNTFRIGRDTRTGSTVLNGEIAVLKLYSRALSQNEIVRLYNATRWRFGV